MKLKYPAEAFALGIILFSAGMKEAFSAGILIILAVVFGEFLKNLLKPIVPMWSLKACVLIGTGSVSASAFLLGFSILIILAVVFGEFLKNLLKPIVPMWSLKACVLIGTGSVSASAFLLGFSALGIAVDTKTWVITFVIGLLAARHVLKEEIEGEYGDLFWECAIIWGFWILLAAVREFCAGGSIFGYTLLEAEFQSKKFLDMTFGFICAGLSLAFTNGFILGMCHYLGILDFAGSSERILCRRKYFWIYSSGG